MYEPTIKVIYRNMRSEFENKVFKAVKDVGIHVDKEELVKALQYDREQYERGYNDGLLHRVDEWISVDERLPDGSGKFLIADEEGHITTASWYRDYGWFMAVCNGTPITHWMPLPEPPKMKGGAEQ